MKRSNHLARWLVAGVSALALTGAGTAGATTEPPDDTTMTTGDTATSDTSETMTGAGPSDCPAITGATEGSAAPDATDAAAGTDAATSDAAATTEAAAEATEAPSESEAPTETTGDTTAPDVSAAPVDGPFVQIVETDEYGPILADANCFTLYAFTQDVDGESTCVDDCLEAWPVLLVPEDAVPPLADELDPALFSVVDSAEGPMLKIGDWPLYYFAGDSAPGDLNGQGVGGVWWVVAPDGTLIEGEAGATDTAVADTAVADTAVADSEPAATAPATTEG